MGSQRGFKAVLSGADYVRTEMAPLGLVIRRALHYKFQKEKKILLNWLKN